MNISEVIHISDGFFSAPYISVLDRGNKTDNKIVLLFVQWQINVFRLQKHKWLRNCTLIIVRNICFLTAEIEIITTVYPGFYSEKHVFRPQTETWRRNCALISRMRNIYVNSLQKQKRLGYWTIVYKVRITSVLMSQKQKCLYTCTLVLRREIYLEMYLDRRKNIITK